jgi:general secretion pathway protein H
MISKTFEDKINDDLSASPLPRFPAFQSFGFTLIELVIVIFIISLATALIMPSFWDKGDRNLKSEAKRISSTLRYVYDEAAGKKIIYTVTFDLDNNSYAFGSDNESRSFQMRKQVMFKNIIIPSHGEITEGEVAVEFGPLGPEEPVTVHLIKDTSEYTVTFNYLNGRSKVLAGYVQ